MFEKRSHVFFFNSWDHWPTWFSQGGEPRLSLSRMSLSYPIIVLSPVYLGLTFSQNKLGFLVKQRTAFSSVKLSFKTLKLKIQHYIFYTLVFTAYTFSAFLTNAMHGLISLSH